MYIYMYVSDHLDHSMFWQKIGCVSTKQAMKPVPGAGKYLT